MKFSSLATTALCLSALVSFSACDKDANKAAPSATDAAATAPGVTPPTADQPTASAPAGAPGLVAGDEVTNKGAPTGTAAGTKVPAGSAYVSDSATGAANNAKTTGTIADTTSGTANTASADRRVSPMAAARQACLQANSALAGNDLNVCIQKRIKSQKM